MASDEYNIESLVIAILEDSATFSGVAVEHWVEDESTVNKVGRISVQAGKRTPFLPGKDPSTPKAWQSAVIVSVRGSVTDTVWDNWSDAIDAAIVTESYAQEVLDNATMFSYLNFDAPDGGDQQGEKESPRTMSRTFRAVFMV